MSSKQMLQNRTNISRILTGYAIEQRSEVDLINRVNNLRDERLLRGLTEVEGEPELAPNIFGGFNLRRSASGRRDEWTGIGRANPRDSSSESSIPVSRQDEAKMTIGTASKGGGNRSSVSLDLSRESLESVVRGLAMDSREHFVLKVSVVDTGKTGRHGRTKE